jgi:hypothetical protein
MGEMQEYVSSPRLQLPARSFRTHIHMSVLKLMPSMVLSEQEWTEGWQNQVEESFFFLSASSLRRDGRNGRPSDWAGCNCRVYVLRTTRGARI